jgi:tetraacyldisaccharide 4'-kinase
MAARRLSYAHGLAKSHRSGLPVISVGNITLGGNAKTPMCAYLAKLFSGQGLAPAILSRGYGRETLRHSPDPLLVSHGQGPLYGPEICGDEPFALSQECQAKIILSRKRAKAARMAESLGCGLIILDDGFQHLSLHRDADIVLLRASQAPAGNGRVIPAGPLREPLWALGAAHIILALEPFGQPDMEGPKGPAQDKPWLGLIPPGPKLFRASLRPAGFRELEAYDRPGPLGEEGLLPLDYPRGRRLAAFCGLGWPGSFKGSLRDLGLSPVAFRAFPDHAPYGERERAGLRDMFRFSRADCLLTTQKDAVKLKGLGLPALALEVRLEPSHPEGLAAAIWERIRGLGPSRPGNGP